MRHTRIIVTHLGAQLAATRLQKLHKRMSDEMAKEVHYLRELTEVVKG